MVMIQMGIKILNQPRRKIYHYHILILKTKILKIIPNGQNNNKSINNNNNNNNNNNYKQKNFLRNL